MGLILTFRPGENIKTFLNDNLEHVEMQITCLGVKGNQVRLHIDADKIYTILRDNLYQQACIDRGITPKEDTLTDYFSNKKSEKLFEKYEQRGYGNKLNKLKNEKNS